MYTLLSVIIIITSILLVLIVLVQNSKGGGLAANFASGNQIFGVRQTADKLEKLTWGFAIALLVACFAATMSMPSQGGVDGSIIQTEMQGVQSPNPTQTAPAAEQTQPQQPVATGTETQPDGQ